MSLLFKGRAQGAESVRVGFFQSIFMFFTDHARQAVNSLGELWRSPFASLMTIGVLGFSITLPSTLYVIVKNTEQISEQWQQASEISLFLEKGVSNADAQQLLKRLRLWPEISEVAYIPADKALEEFQLLSGFGDALNYLEENPLPAVVLVVPTSKHASPTAAGILLDKLRKEREVEIGKLDIEWLERLYALINIAKDLVTLLAVLLFFAVVLIIGNTIRLNILNKKDEIVVMKLVGATDAFIQRPFLYTGFWFGLLGGIMAWVTVLFILLWVDFSMDAFMEKYQVDFNITAMDLSTLLIMLMMSVGLGLAGSILSVQRHVKDIEPR
ncbi:MULTISPECIES: permease-like cell division protein FtsX [Alteromonadaceae]|jgi:cell division transport system permease protein|uniref:Cell division protein FtsX n=1 Tax=Brumicola blandensis TaxID=3075611 RepID=A0AAW8R2H3_9ALTE|nr:MULTISPECIES: permease-like cell division protein FtsX [unclassified Alteromonas]MDT0582396.1 permease-like cell division protein FtsX [Alteromonas sp. W409]MDT0628618.1 permease-like cell division protein FtsX [Alteromonas sp. W364]